jgi:predicted transcriptional regulator
MSGQLRQGTIRVSYVEDKTTATALDILATAKQTNKSALLREATAEFLAKADPNREIMKLAKQLANALPDDSKDRAKADLDPDLQADVAKLLRKLKG